MCPYSWSNVSVALITLTQQCCVYRGRALSTLCSCLWRRLLLSPGMFLAAPVQLFFPWACSGRSFPSIHSAVLSVCEYSETYLFERVSGLKWQCGCTMLNWCKRLGKPISCCFMQLFPFQSCKGVRRISWYSQYCCFAVGCAVVFNSIPLVLQGFYREQWLS